MRKQMGPRPDAVSLTKAPAHARAVREGRGESDALVRELARKELAELGPVICVHLPSRLPFDLLEEGRCHEYPQGQISWQRMLRLLVAVVEVHEVKGNSG